MMEGQHGIKYGKPAALAKDYTCGTLRRSMKNTLVCEGSNHLAKSKLPPTLRLLA
jgi:hypothetical protein